MGDSFVLQTHWLDSLARKCLACLVCLVCPACQECPACLGCPGCHRFLAQDHHWILPCWLQCSVHPLVVCRSCQACHFDILHQRHAWHVGLGRRVLATS